MLELLKTIVEWMFYLLAFMGLGTLLIVIIVIIFELILEAFSGSKSEDTEDFDN